VADKVYKLTYQVDANPEGMTAEQLEVSGKGGSDAMLICSILRLNETGAFGGGGGKSFLFLTKDGTTGEEIPLTEMFQVFNHLAYELLQRGKKDPGKLPVWQAVIASEAFERTREHILASRRAEGADV